MTKSKTRILQEYINQFPDLGHLPLAKLIINEVPEFKNDEVDVLRKVISFMRGGAMGENDFFEDIQVEFEIPDSWYYEPEKYEFEGKVAIINDIHIPFHDKFALKTAIDYLIKYNPDVVLLNGDIGDYYANSRFVRDPNLRNLAKEIEIINQFLDYLQSKFTRIVYKEGNHEERLYDYIALKAPELGDIEGVKLQSLLRLDQRNIIYIENRNRIKIGKLSVIHGNEIPAAGIINVARTKIIRAMGNVLFGHHHVTQDFTQRTIDDRVIGAWSVGCLCGLSPRFSKFNSWNHGFAIVETDSDGNFEVQNKKIVNNRVV